MLGATFASFGNLIAWRVPKKVSINGHSHCDQCQHQLRFVDVLPIFGFLINGGKCHYCKTKIPVRHLLIEIMGGLLFTLSFLLIGWSLELIVALVLITVMLIESLSDAYHTEVIDTVWIIGAVPLLVIRIIDGTILTHLLSSGIMFGLMFLLAFLGEKIFKKEAFGGGDIKLYAFIGLALPIYPSLLSLFFASAAGFIYAIINGKKAGQYIPLVPFIGFGVLISYFYGQALLDWYMNLIRY